MQKIPVLGYLWLVGGLFVGGALLFGSGYLAVVSLATGEPYDLSNSRDLMGLAINFGFSAIICFIGVNAARRVVLKGDRGDSGVLTGIAKLAVPILLVGAAVGIFGGYKVVESHNRTLASIAEFEQERLEREAVERKDEEERLKAYHERIKSQQ